MADSKNAAQAGVSVPPLDLHHQYLQQAAAGYTRDVMLSSHAMQSITRSLRGINAIAAVLIAGDETETLRLGDWLRGGLIEAVNALSWNMAEDLERANDRAALAQKRGEA